MMYFIKKQNWSEYNDVCVFVYNPNSVQERVTDFRPDKILENVKSQNIGEYYKLKMKSFKTQQIHLTQANHIMLI